MIEYHIFDVLGLQKNVEFAFVYAHEYAFLIMN